MAESTKRRALGRGLDSLLPGSDNASTQTRANDKARIEELHPNREQPRSLFNDERLEELAQSIRELGVLEPILVRKRAAGGFEIIAGERRWRAAQRAGLQEVPICVRELSESEAFEAALVENVQREDLNPIEIARAFQRLIDEHNHTQETMAERVGKSRSAITNSLRLLKLPEAVLDYVETGVLSEGHGRALLGAPTAAAMKKLARQAIDSGWSVRETERRARQLAEPEKAKNKPERSANVRDLEQRLSRSLGSQVRVSDRQGKGQLQIRFTSYDELDRLLEVLLS